VASSGIKWTCRASAGSRSLLCQWLKQLTAQVIADALLEFTCRQKPNWFDNGALTVDPLWFYLIEPGTLGGQPARFDCAGAARF
jgi:hypothetical protein